METQNSDQNIKEVILETVKELVKRMGIEIELEMKIQKQDEQENMICSLNTEESNYLIGQYGINLQALQHIARVIVRKKIDQKVNFIIDVNSYRQEKNESIALLADNTARQVILEKRAITLRPMSPYERRLVHLELAKNDQVKTESIGEGNDRRIVIKLRDLI